jgi:Family of unknown function (DUF5808)
MTRAPGDERPLPIVARVADHGVMSRKRASTDTRRRWIGLGVGAALLGAALATELRKPAGERTWQGRIAGRVPYDLRPPTPTRVRHRLWNPADRRLLVPTVFGVGWTVNLGRLLEPWVAELPEAGPTPQFISVEDGPADS